MAHGTKSMQMKFHVLKRCFNVAFNVKRKLGLQSKNNVDNYMVQVSTLKAYR